MLRIAGTLAYSATDLNNFLACEHLTGLEHAVALGALERPQIERAQADVLRELGETHERKYLEKLEASGVEVVAIPRPERGNAPGRAVAATIEAMRAGPTIIYQAAFFHDGWLGFADFLRRVDGASDLGDYHYEVADTKLARRIEPYFILQLCNYSEHVARVQGFEPRRMHVVLGDGREESFEVGEFAAHYRAVKARFLRHARNGVDETEPYPVLHCELCAWKDRCDAQLRAADSLSQVAGIRRLQTNRLVGGGIETLAALSRAGDDVRPANVRASTFATLRRQARLQREHRDAIAAGDLHPNSVEVIEPDPEMPQPRGFALLPERDAGDLFFDMEGDPYYVEGDRWFGAESGLEYLFGVYALDGPEGTFTPFWGCDRDGTDAPHHRYREKRAFEDFIDFVMARRAAHERFHIYHYASYEVTAMKHLSERHRTREEEVDILLREERFVDLFKVVRQSIVVGQPSYSIKKLEFYYEGDKRTGTASGGDSIVEFEKWLASRAAGTPLTEILEDIEQYNRFDCVSTEHLLAWLWSLHVDTPAVAPREIEAPKPQSAKRAHFLEELGDVLERLLALCPPDTVAENALDLHERERAAWLLNDLLQYHERERRPPWWEFFDLCAAFADDPEVAVDNAAAIGDLTVVEVTGEGTLMAFPAQNHRVDADYVRSLETRMPHGKVEWIDDERGLLLWRPSKGKSTVPPLAIVQVDDISSEVIVRSLMRSAERLLASSDAVPDDPFFDLLLARKPRLVGAGRGSVVQPEVVDAPGVAAVIDRLDGTCLPIQGPPGTGKTTKAAAIICGLVDRGMRVGIAAPSHAVAHNLLARIGTYAAATGKKYRVAHNGGGDKEFVPQGRAAEGFSEVLCEVDGATDAQIVSGTSWLFSKPALAGALDYLFVDEAGQLALANALGMTPAARNVILVGDPQQLEQVTKVSHAGPADVSALGHLIGDEPTVAPNRGVFLDTTYRMHGDVCTFVSRVSYEGRLNPDAGCAHQRVDSPGLSGTGLRALAVPHEGNKSASVEEAERIADEITRLLEGEIVDRDGVRRAIRPADIIVVTPYNAQRRLLDRTIRERAGDGIE
ncbi:MAG: TM0106 family RecB-like putative nuclease, partial [Candidatus Eremiobacteraeota bacterium]|nr:TM0106 family RecB-like putative nuclease [Candidatus Eremiobacteraeota bacterium]